MYQRARMALRYLGTRVLHSNLHVTEACEVPPLSRKHKQRGQRRMTISPGEVDGTKASSLKDAITTSCVQRGQQNGKGT